MKKYMSLVTLMSFWLVQCVLPFSALAAPKWYVAPVSGANGGIDGVSVGVSIPTSFGRKIVEPVREPVLMAANLPKQHKIVESSSYDRGQFYTQAMGRPSGFTSKEEFVSFVESGSANATPAQYREALAQIGVQLADDSALVQYLGGLEWVSNSNSFNSRMGRLLVDRNTSAKKLDGGFVREVEANEFVLLDSSVKPPRPIVAGDCGNVILGVVGAAAAPATSGTIPREPEVRSVFITPTEAPQQKRQATGYGMFANGQQEERKLSPASYGGTTVVVTQSVNVQKDDDDSHWGAWILGGLAIIGAGVAIYFATKKGDCDTDVNVNITTPTPSNPEPVDPPEPHPPEPPPVEPPPVEPPPEPHPPEPEP